MGVLVIPEGKTVLFRIAIFIGLGTVVTTIIYLTPVPGMDSSCKTLAFRSSVVVALATAVATILYFTPLPDQYPQSCSRPCHELDWPMICRVKLTFERYQTLGSSCRDCPGNQTDCYHDTCITVDGQAKGILAANRQFPGPTLQVCQHDIMVVDIVNRIPGQSFGVHWRGQPQSETPYMDGVPMITQCPIPSLTTFQYKFRASEAGTHVWQVNTGEEISDTLIGPLIVRRPDSKEIHRKLYDTDDTRHVMVIHTWNPQRTNYLFQDEAPSTKLLINGKTQENNVPPAVFKITRGKRHRFRVIYMGGAKSCQVRLSIDKHRFLVIALDGHSIKPKMVASAKLFPGERLDFVLRGDQKPAHYYMRATPSASCDGVVATRALIQYNDAEKAIAPDSYDNELLAAAPEMAEFQTPFSEDCGSHGEHPTFCKNPTAAAKQISEELRTDKLDKTLYLFYKSAVVSKKNIVNTTFVAIDDTVIIPQTNNLTMMLPSSPLLSQGHHISADVVCNNESIPERCRSNVENICECVHVVDIPLNAVVELVLVNQDKEDHVLHLHGYSFHIIGASKIPSSMDPEKIKYLDSVKKLVERNFDFPLVKDTVAVISNSVVVLRLKANNPGYWLLDDERTSYWSRGMSLVLHVGKNSHLTPIPKNFPKCGDWIGPEFFLV